MEEDLVELDEEDEQDMLGGTALASNARAAPLSREEARAAMLRAKEAGSDRATAEGANAAEGDPRGELVVSELVMEENDEAVPRFAFSGQFIEPTDAPEPQPAKPSVEPSLEWVHGYRGWDCRGNVCHVLGGSAVAYPAAGVVVVHDGTAQSFFRGHTDDVLSMAVHPDGRTVASGQIGKRAKVLVWDAETKEVVTVLEGTASRAARHVAFSGDGAVVAVAGEDDNHTVALYRWRESAKPFAVAQAGRDPVNGIALSDDGSSLLTVGKRIAMVHSGVDKSSSSGGKRSKSAPVMASKKVLMSGKGKIQTFWAAAFDSAGRGFIGTHSGRVYELAPGGRAVVRSNKVHTGPVSAVRVQRSSDGSDVMTTTSKDGSVRVHRLTKSKGLGEEIGVVTNDAESGSMQCTRGASVSPDLSSVAYGTRGGRVVLAPLDGSSAGTVLTTSHHSDELWGVAVSPDSSMVATAGDDFTVRVWSVAEHREVASADVGIMARAVAFSHDGSLLAIGCGGRVGRLRTGTHGKDDGTVVVLSFPGLAEVARVRPSRQWIGDVAFSPDDSSLAVASHDNMLYLLDAADGFRTRGTGRGASSFLTRVDFTADGAACRATTGAHELLFYDGVTAARLPGGAGDFKDAKWHTVRCALNWHVQGVWPSYADGTDINGVAVDPDQGIIASGDDFGRVRLYRFPCIENDMWESIDLLGHCSHVTSVCFAARDEADGALRLFSAGGNDKSLMQWKLAPVEDAVAGMTDLGAL